MRKILTGAALVAPLLLAAPVQAQVINLVTNGEFNNGLNDWIVTGTSSDVSVVGGANPQARITTTAAGPAGLQQAVTVTPGDVYDITFQVGIEAVDLVPGSYSFQAQWGGATLLSLSGQTPPDFSQGLTSYTFRTQAPSASTLLSFSGEIPALFFSIDAVEVERVPGPLPLLGAVAAFAWSRKLRNRIKDARQQGSETVPA